MLNEALRLIRVYHDMSKAELAREIGISRSYVTELELGSKKVSLEIIEKYAKYFEIPMSSIMLFAERTNEYDFSERARSFVAGKTLKMLDWVSMISKKNIDVEV